MTHRSAGIEVTRAVEGRIKPSGRPQALSYAARPYPENPNSPPLLANDTTVSLADLQFAAEREHATNLADLLFRRTGAGWTESMAGEAAGRAASAVAGVLGWDDARIACEITDYRDYLARNYLTKGQH